MGRLRIKRVDDVPSAEDGYRVLVDRLWPRGVSRDGAALDAWRKDLAPSPGLRGWWRHDPARLDEFARRYQGELDRNPAVEDVVELVRDRDVTLLYSAGGPRANEAAVLRDYLNEYLDDLASGWV